MSDHPSSDQRVYRVSFQNQGKVFEIYAASVSQGGLFGFIEVEEILFGEKSAVLVDPSEEALKHEFDGVKRTYIPMHSVLRIDQVDKQGTARIRKSEGETDNLTSFPVPMMPPSSRK